MSSLPFLHRTAVAFGLAGVGAAACTRALPRSAELPAPQASPPSAPAADNQPLPVQDKRRWWLEPVENIASSFKGPQVFWVGPSLIVTDWANGAFALTHGQRTPLAAPLDRELTFWGTPAVTGGLLLGTRDTGLLDAVDAKTMVLRWESRLENDHFNGSDLIIGNTLVIRAPYQNLHRVDLLGIDVGSGAVRWRQPVGDDWNDSAGRTLAAAGPLVVVNVANTDHPLLAAFEATTGALRWSVAEPRLAPILVANADVVVAYAKPKTRTVFDVQTGKVLDERVDPRAPDSYPPASAVLDGQILYLGAAGRGTVTAYDVARRQELWTRPVEPRDSGDPPLQVGAAEVVTCTGRTFRVFDKTNGNELWSYGLRASPPYNRCPPFATAPGPVLYAAEDSGEVRVFRRSEVPAETAAVSGSILGRDSKPVEHAVVRVGNVEVVSGPQGRFEATVTSRGFVHLSSQLPAHADNCEPSTDTGTAIVSLTGAGTYAVEMNVEDVCSPDESNMN